MTQFNQLSNREWEVVKLLLQGKSNKLIASSLGISDRTVEFHLKNIYAKFQVNSRVELILKLGSSTVDSLGKSADNRDKFNSRMDSARSDTTSIIGKELKMKKVLVGVITALFVGFLWLTMLIYVGSMSFSEIKSWAMPLIVTLTMIGLSVGLTGKRNGNTLRRIFFSTLFGTGLSPFLIIPLMLIIVLPLGKVAASFGLIDPITMSSDVATMLAMIAMIAIWLVFGIVIGITLLFLTVKTHLPEHSLQ